MEAIDVVDAFAEAVLLHPALSRPEGILPALFIQRRSGCRLPRSEAAGDRLRLLLSVFPAPAQPAKTTRRFRCLHPQATPLSING